MDGDLLYVPDLVPVFPLPQVVLFPGTLLPLHVFEPRYRDLTADALAGAGVLAIALLRPGFEPLYYTRRAPIHPTVGLARIVGSEQVADGNYNILLRGVSRARIVEESGGRPYRVARIEPVPTYCSGDESQLAQVRAELSGVIRGNPALASDLRRHWLRLCDAPLQPDELADLIAAGLPAAAEVRQCLLEEPDAAARLKMLVDGLRTLTAIAEARRRADTTSDHRFN